MKTIFVVAVMCENSVLNVDGMLYENKLWLVAARGPASQAIAAAVSNAPTFSTIEREPSWSTNTVAKAPVIRQARPLRLPGQIERVTPTIKLPTRTRFMGRL